MSLGKENFLRTRLVGYFQQLHPATEPRWGQMDLRQVVEHLADAVTISSGKRVINEQFTRPEELESMRDFLRSDRRFGRNIPNPWIQSPILYRHNTLRSAIADLHQELIYFFEVFDAEPGKTTQSPFFGELDFEGNIRLLYKHSLHHLRQFGVEPLGI